MDPAQVRYENGDVKAGGLTMSFGTLLRTCDVPAVEATATSPGNSNSTVSYRSFGAHFGALDLIGSATCHVMDSFERVDQPLQGRR